MPWPFYIGLGWIFVSGLCAWALCRGGQPREPYHAPTQADHFERWDNE